MKAKLRFILNSVLRQPRFLAILVAGLLAGILITVGLVTFYQVRSEALEKEAQTRVNLRAREMADKIEAYLISARQLASSAANLIAPLREDKEQVEQTLLRLLRSAPAQTIHGVGAWFEPRRFDGETRYFGPYAHRAEKKGAPPVMTYEWTGADYNFHRQPWYLAGKKANGELAFTEPYFDTDMVYMSASQAFFDKYERFTGVITVDMVLPLLYKLVLAENTDPREIIYVTTSQQALFVHPRQDDLLAFAREQGKDNIKSLLELKQAILKDFRGELSADSHLTASSQVAYTGWTVHVETEKSFLLGELERFGNLLNLALLGLWLLVLLGVAGLLRLSVLSFSARLEEEQREAERRERAEAEENLRKAREEQALLEEKVAERTRELSQAYKKLKASQTQLVQAEKMSSLGQMVAGLAHEINTPLGYIRNNVEMLKRAFKETEKLMDDYDRLAFMLTAEDADEDALGEHIQSVLQNSAEFRENEVFEETRQLMEDSGYGVEQISELVMNLKDFSRLDLAMVENTDLNLSLDKVLKIAHHKLKHKVTVKKQYAEQLPKVKCAPSQINQVFLNLLTNAAQAMESGEGEVILKTWSDEKQVHVSIQDNGKGIPKDQLSKIFDPFFTTKPVGEGTGLGLSISHQIVRQHKGNIRVASEVGKGTRFVISLPRGVAPSSSPPEKTSLEEPAAVA